MATLRLLSEREVNILRGKFMVRFKPNDDVWTLVNHLTLLEHELDQLDNQDFFGTEGWRHQLDVPEAD